MRENEGFMENISNCELLLEHDSGIFSVFFIFSILELKLPYIQIISKLWDWFSRQRSLSRNTILSFL